MFSETFPSRDEALAAAQAAAEEQERPGADEAIEYQDEDGRWREEEAPGFDRPHTAVEDEPEG